MYESLFMHCYVLTSYVSISRKILHVNKRVTHSVLMQKYALH